MSTIEDSPTVLFKDNASCITIFKGSYIEDSPTILFKDNASCITIFKGSYIKGDN